jgi:hypothetical protein
MTPVEWIAAVTVVVGLWAYALLIFVDNERHRSESPLDLPDALADEIARWEAAADRTYARQARRLR